MHDLYFINTCNYVPYTDGLGWSMIQNGGHLFGDGNFPLEGHSVIGIYVQCQSSEV